MKWPIVAAVAALAAYTALSYWLMANAPGHPLAVAALFGPLLAAFGFDGWRRRHLPTLLFCAALALLLAVVVARGGVADARRLYVLQHAGMHAALAWTFGMTLRPGGKALITRLAEPVHVHFTEAMRAYTRWLTGLWVVYFIGMIVVSLAIYVLAPWSWWSLYCNLLTPLAAVLLFVGEHIARRLRHPEFERATLAQAIRASRSVGVNLSR